AAPAGDHGLATLFHAVSLTEDISATPAEGISVHTTGRWAHLVQDDETNLAHQAATLLADTCGITRGVQLDVVKNVPVAGGMAGGSADAAGALLACDLLWRTGLSREELVELAAGLGADVPFALTAEPRSALGPAASSPPRWRAACTTGYWRCPSRVCPLRRLSPHGTATTRTHRSTRRCPTM